MISFGSIEFQCVHKVNLQHSSAYMYEDDEDIDYAMETCVIGSLTFQITTVEFLPIEKLMSMHAKDAEVT